MGRDKNEAINAKISGSSRREAKKDKGPLVTYNLTSVDKERLKSGVLDIVKALESIEGALDQGHRLSVGLAVDKGGTFVILREAHEDWQKAVAVSFWAGSLEKALVMCGYYLQEVNPDFPDGVQLKFNDNDW